MDSTKDFSRIYLLSVDTRQKQGLTNGPDLDLNDISRAFSPDGKYLAFSRGSNEFYDIYIQPVKGSEAVRLTFDNTWIAGLTWTPDGSDIIYSSGGVLWRISATGGEPTPVPASGDNLIDPVVAHRGNLLACVQTSEDYNIWRVEISRLKSRQNSPSKHIHSTQYEGLAQYSPDEKKIAYVSVKSGSPQVWVCDSDGQNDVQLTSSDGNAEAWNPAWSPDGRMIAFDGNYEGQNEIFTIPVDGGAPNQITKNPADDRSPRYSIDGHWIYFTSNRTGVWQIWKIPAEGGDAVQVTNDGGFIVRESTDGKWLYYTKDDTMGIWKKPLPDGEEIIVLNCNIEEPTQWDLAEDGIYYIKWAADNNAAIDFYDFSNEKSTEIFNTGERRFISDLDISSDRHWIT
jgi:Tol biopolymer transport system component